MLFAPAAFSPESQKRALLESVRDQGAQDVSAGYEPLALSVVFFSRGSALTQSPGALLLHLGPACSGARGHPDPVEPLPGAEGLRMM